MAFIYWAFLQVEGSPSREARQQQVSLVCFLKTIFVGSEWKDLKSKLQSTLVLEITHSLISLGGGTQFCMPRFSYSLLSFG